MAEAIKNFSSRNGICARYGGDEFACVLITDHPADLPADTVRNRFDHVLLAKEEVRSKAYRITASVGSARAIIDERLDIDQLLGEADEMMYKDKKQRKQSAGAGLPRNDRGDFD